MSFLKYAKHNHNHLRPLRLLRSLENKYYLVLLFLLDIPLMLVRFCDTLMALLRKLVPESMIAWSTLSTSANYM